MSKFLRVLKDGFWECTSVIRGPDGALRVRKESKEGASAAPWAEQALRNEIQYIRALPDSLRPWFPSLLDTWEAAGEPVAYEIPYYEDREDFAHLVLSGAVGQEQCGVMQEQLVAVVLEGLHQTPPCRRDCFASHVDSVLLDTLDSLATNASFRPVVERPSLLINDREVAGMRVSLDRVREIGLFARLEAADSVLLHGDLILENILWSPLLLIDPVSVAGLASGPALFDLVKYESYATGELYAIRQELVWAGIRDGRFFFEVDWDAPSLASYRRLDLTSLFRAGYESVHGAVDPALYALIDAYFSLVMARNTRGSQQWARVLKGCLSLAEAAGAPR